MNIENDNIYGNAAAVFTTSGEIAKTISENASAAIIYYHNIYREFLLYKYCRMR